MKVSIKRTKIVKKEENRVTSPLFRKTYSRVTKGDVKPDENGIFSKKIFGNFYSCDCGELKEPGICEKCGTRVIDKANMPDFYIDLPCHVAVVYADYESVDPVVKEILDYNAFVYNNEVYIACEDTTFIKYDLYLELGLDRFKMVRRRRTMNEETEEEVKSKIDPNQKYIETDFNENDILIGIDALKALDISDEWIEENTTDYILIPHTSYRPLTPNQDRTNYYLGDLNNLYLALMQNINDILSYNEMANGRPMFCRLQYQGIAQLYDKIMDNLFDQIHSIKHNVVKYEVIAHPLSGAIRAVLTNRCDLNEDILLIGDTFIETLFPVIYHKHNGNMMEINRELIESDAYVLLNRAPTISHYSVMAMKPRVASMYPFGEIEGTNGGSLENTRLIEKDLDTIGLFEDEEGDIERFSTKINAGNRHKNNEDELIYVASDEEVHDSVHEYLDKDLNDFDITEEDCDYIDTLGLRVIGANPIMFDGLGADTDGDVLFVIALYSNAAKAQAVNLLPSKAYLNYANGSIRNKIVEDLLFQNNNNDDNNNEE